MKLERARIKPARKGLIVLDPDRGNAPLPAEGLEVTLSSYWVRRIADGDVVREDAPAAASTPKPKPSAAT